MRNLRAFVVVAMAVVALSGCGSAGSDGSNGVTAPTVAGAATVAPTSATPSLPPCDEVPLSTKPLMGTDLTATLWVPRLEPVSADGLIGLGESEPGQDAISQLVAKGATLRAWTADGERAGITVYTRVNAGDGNPNFEQVVLVTSGNTRYPVYLAPTSASACGLADLIDQTDAVAQGWAPGSAHTGVQVRSLDGRPVGGGTVRIGTVPFGE